MKSAGHIIFFASIYFALSYSKLKFGDASGTFLSDLKISIYRIHLNKTAYYFYDKINYFFQ